MGIMESAYGACQAPSVRNLNLIPLQGGKGSVQAYFPLPARPLRMSELPPAPLCPDSPEGHRPGSCRTGDGICGDGKPELLGRLKTSFECRNIVRYGNTVAILGTIGV